MIFKRISVNLFVHSCHAGRQKTSSFLLLCTRLFVSLTAFKILSLGINEDKNFIFSSSLHSFIRIFVAKIQSFSNYKFRVMMRNTLVSLMLILMSSPCFSQKVITLPAPDKSVSMSLYDALSQRASVRSFAKTKVSDQLLSQLLWAACGVNRPDGRLTAPSAVNAQDVVVYVCRADGAYRYDSSAHSLVQVSKKDLRKAVAGRQDFAAEAPVSLVLVSYLERLPNQNVLFGGIDTGYVSQNICLACTALGLATVPRATMDTEVLTAELGLDNIQVPMINNPVGYEK